MIPEASLTANIEKRTFNPKIDQWFYVLFSMMFYSNSLSRNNCPLKKNCLTFSFSPFVPHPKH